MENALHFFRSEAMPLLRNIKSDDTPLWGKLSAQGMIEHLVETTELANGTIVKDYNITPPELIEKSHAFLRSDKAFRPDTKNPEMAEEPAPLLYASMEEALTQLDRSVQLFVAKVAEPNYCVHNPIFGDLDQALSLSLMYKHFTHHLKQFGQAIALES